MLDFNDILSTPGLDVQYFTGTGQDGIFGNLTPVTISTDGVLGVSSSFSLGGYLVGQSITVSGTLSSGTINGTANYTTPVTFYILAATASSMTISATPNGAPVATTTGTGTPGATFRLNSEWQTWHKPRGVKNVYMIGVGGGASGQPSANVSPGNSGGAGGGSGAQTCVWIPAMFVPDVLYIKCGAGGKYSERPVTGITTNHGGGPTYVTIEPSSSFANTMTLLVAAGGQSDSIFGGQVASLGGFDKGMMLAARGYYTFFSGHLGSTGAITPPTTGLMVTGGTGGGTSGVGGAAGGAGGSIDAPTGFPINDFFFTQAGAAGAAGATPAAAGIDGTTTRNFIMNYGGMGGGGASTTSGGQAGAGGNGAPGCGGGGAGGSTNVAGANTLARPGNGGDGFVLILSW